MKDEDKTKSQLTHELTFMPKRLAELEEIENERKRAEEALLEYENKFKSFPGQALVGIYLIQDDMFRYVNPKFAELFGYTVEECLDCMPFKQLIYPDDIPLVAMQVAKRTSGQAKSVQYTFRGIRKDGKVIDVEIYGGSVVYNRKPAAIGALLDISEVKRAQEALHRLKRQIELILDSAADGILGLDLEGRHTFVNPAAAQILGYDVAELLGRRSHTIWHHTRKDGRSHSEDDCPIYRSIRDGMVHHETDDIFWKKDGTEFAVEYTSSPIFEGEKIAGSVLIFKDITERKRAEEDLKLERKNLAEANAALRVLLRHREEDRRELEEALLTNVKNLVLPFAEKLKNTRLTPDQVLFLEIVESHLKDITSPFLRTLSRQFAGLTPMEIQVANLIRDGRTTKEIATILVAAEDTVAFHRHNLRRKLGLTQKKINLRSYLSSLP